MSHVTGVITRRWPSSSLCQGLLRRAFSTVESLATGLHVDSPAGPAGGSLTGLETYVESKGVLLKGTPVYLDTQATTPLDPRVLDHMLPFMTDLYGNPHSRTHLFGWETEDAVEVARGQVASLIGANAKEIIFTSGRRRATTWPSRAWLVSTRRRSGT